jgi:hypothetical protein
MLQKLSLSTADCQQRAADCEALAEQTTDPQWKQTFHRIADHWRFIASCRQFAQRTSALLDEQTS